MSTLAVFIALGGASYAALKPAANSVGAKQIKKNAVRSPEVKNKALKLADISPGAVDDLKGERGEPGPQGPKGDTGDVATWRRATVEAAEPKTATNASFGPFADLATPGPSVDVDVPASGIAEVFAQVHINGPTNSVAGVGLAVDGAPASSIACTNVPGLLINATADSDADWATGGGTGAVDGLDCGTAVPGHPGSLMVTGLAPGTHTFKLVYAAASVTPPQDVTFSNRRLYVAPRP